MKQLFIEANDAEQRLDKFLKKLLKNASISYIYKLNRKGNIKVNKKKKKNDYSIQKGDEIKIFLSDDEYNSLIKTQTQISPNTKSSKKLEKKDIIYEDDNLLIVNKKPGIIVHPGDFKTTDLSLIEQVHDYVSHTSWGHTFKPSLAHRIDKDTSGIVVIAKQKQLLSQLVSDFKNHKNITKTYRAFCFGPVSRTKGTIKKKLLRIENATGENKIQLSEKGQTAVTHFSLQNSYKIHTGKEEIQIHDFEINIETGRMHQIRVHMASLGNPIIGDSKYGNKKLNSYIKNHFHISRQLLHAEKLSLYNSLEKKEVSFKAPFPQDIKNFQQNLRK